MSHPEPELREHAPPATGGAKISCHREVVRAKKLVCGVQTPMTEVCCWRLRAAMSGRSRSFTGGGCRWSPAITFAAPARASWRSI